MTEYYHPDSIAPQRPRTSGTAVTSLVLGLLLCIPIFSGILAVIFGLVGLSATRDARVAGRGLAIAGLILGLLNLAGWGGLSAMFGLTYEASKPGRAVARQVLSDLSAGNLDPAMANSAPPMTRGTMETLASEIQKFGAFKGITFTSFNLRADNSGTALFLGGFAQFAQGSKFCTFQLVKQGTQFKVTALHVQ